MTPREFAYAMDRLTPEQVAQAMEKLPTDVLEWAVKFEALAHAGPLLTTCTGERPIEHPGEDLFSDPRLRSHSNQSRWDQTGFMVEQLRREGLTDTEIAQKLHITQRTVKRRRGRVTP